MDACEITEHNHWHRLGAGGTGKKRGTRASATTTKQLAVRGSIAVRRGQCTARAPVACTRWRHEGRRPRLAQQPPQTGGDCDRDCDDDCTCQFEGWEPEERCTRRRHAAASGAPHRHRGDCPRHRARGVRHSHSNTLSGRCQGDSTFSTLPQVQVGWWVGVVKFCPRPMKTRQLRSLRPGCAAGFPPVTRPHGVTVEVQKH